MLEALSLYLPCFFLQPSNLFSVPFKPRPQTHAVQTCAFLTYKTRPGSWNWETELREVSQCFTMSLVLSSTYRLPRPSGVWGETPEWWPLSQTSDRQTGGQESEASQELHESMKVRICLMTDTTGILGTLTNPTSPHWELPLPRRGPNILFRWTQTLCGNAQEKSMNQNMKFGDRVLYLNPGFIIYLLYGLEKFI